MICTGQSDTRIGMDILSLLCRESTRAVVATVEGPPASKARPRFARGGRVYTPKESEAAESAMAAALRSAIDGRPFASNVALGCVFFRPNRQRIDTDNMLKLVMDAGTKAGVWADDSQVTAMIGLTELDAERPRTVIILGEHRSTMPRGTAREKPCVHCGKSFLPPVPTQQTCSRACSYADRGMDLSVPAACAQCGLPFRRTSKYVKMCSPECRKAWMRGRRQPGKAPGHCNDCGVETSKPEYVRCRACWKVARKDSIDTRAA